MDSRFADLIPREWIRTLTLHPTRILPRTKTPFTTANASSKSPSSHMILVRTLASMLATRVEPQRVSWKMNPVGLAIGTALVSSTLCAGNIRTSSKQRRDQALELR